MENKPLVSYIVPVFNAEAYVERCVESLLKQTYPRIEIVLVDDGSTDTSGQLCDQLSLCNPTIQVYHIPNGGASFARKYGLSQAHGEYVGFVDSDDTVDVCITERLMSALQHFSFQIAVCENKKSLDDSKDWSIPTFLEVEPTVLEHRQLMERFFHYDFWGLCGKLYHKSVFNSLHFPKATINEDYALMAQLFTHYPQVAYVNSPLYHYRVHPGGLSSLALNERKFEEMENTAYVFQYMVQHSPQYTHHALAIYMESCIKLLSLTYAQSAMQNYPKQVRALQKAMRMHLWASMKNPCLYWKLKIMLLMLLFTPKLLKVIY